MQSLIETQVVDRYFFDAFNGDIAKAVFFEAPMATEAAAFASVDSVSAVPLADDNSVHGSGENPGEHTTNDDKDNNCCHCRADSGDRSCLWNRP